MRQPRILTDEEKATIQRLRGEGMGKKDIAKEIKCGTQVIIKYLNEIGEENKRVGRKKVTLHMLLENDDELYRQFIRCYNLDYLLEMRVFSVRDMVKRRKKVKISDNEVIEEFKTLNLYTSAPKDLTCKSVEENEEFMLRLIGSLLENADKYPVLQKMLIDNDAKILYNQAMKDRNGYMVTKFDIVIPKLHTIIVNLKDVMDKKEWMEKAGMYILGKDIGYMTHIGNPLLCFTIQPIESILESMEEKVKSIISRERQFSKKTEIKAIYMA